MAATFGNLTFTKYDDGSIVMQYKKGDEILLYKHFTSAEKDTLNTEVDSAGIAGAPVLDGGIPLFPGEPGFRT